jgi:DNA-directed RNA polymerase II subunit RPB1
MPDTIIGVQFGITSPQEIAKRSVVEITTDKTFQGTTPVPGGVFDSRLGVIESGKVCPTCKHTNQQCQGHFGHITLARPVYLYQYLDQIIKILRNLCMNCSLLYIDGEAELGLWADALESTLEGMDRLNDINEKTNKYKGVGKNKKLYCPHCETMMVKTVVKVLGTVCTLQAIPQTADDDEMDPVSIPIQSEMVLRCFQRMSEETIRVLGFNPTYSHPAWMVCTVLAVPPLTVRPSVVMDDNQRMEDDLTHKLIDIVRNNQRLRERIDRGDARDSIEKHTVLLELDVATYVDNDIKGIPPASQRSGRPLKTLKSRLGAKTGRVRGNLMGKRVDFSARSVITPDANIDLDELGVPLEIATNLTKPEIVTIYNRERLKAYVRNGPAVWPGAKTVFLKKDKRTLSLRYVNADTLDLQPGDIVHRHLIDGDRVLFNRQPSLHKGSMECHRVKVLPYSTFRLNVSATRPYNADFDGDEMNMHVPQSMAAETEIGELASVLRLIVSPRDAAPIIQLFQDTLTGAYRISNPGVSIPEHVAMNFMARLKRPMSTFVRRDEEHTGRETISAAFPLMNMNESIKLKNGQLVEGLLQKSAFGSASRGSLHIIFNDFGPDRCGQFINEMQQIVTKYNLYSGFSVGTSDLVSNPETSAFVEETLKNGREEVQRILMRMHAGQFTHTSGRSDGDELENQIFNKLKEVSEKISSAVLKSLPKSNRMLQMVDAGTKGSGLNISQMMALLGQQVIDGKRVRYTLQDRTLPHFSKYDDGIESRGFVQNSFVKGLRPEEFFFHAQGGREGLIDTAVKTSDTGYIQRRMMKTMEDVHVANDHTIRKADGTIIQYLYGEDGVDSVAIEMQPCDLALMTLETVYKNYALSMTDPSSGVQLLCSETLTEAPDMVEEILKDRDMLVRSVFRYEKNDVVRAPVHLKRLCEQYRNPYSTMTDLTPRYVIDELNKLMKEPWLATNKVFHMLLRFYLAPKKSIVEYRFTKEIFDEVLKEIRYRTIKSLVHAGEMVGAIAAQSIGEPTTQLTLNTFHSAGTVKAGATQGVPRIEELLEVSKNPKSPLTFVYMRPELSSDLEQAIRLKREIQRTSIRDITRSVRIYYDPYPLSDSTVVTEDREILASFQAFSVGKPDCVSPWIFRLEFDRTEMASRNITDDMTGIQNALLGNLSIKISQCVFSDMNAKKLVCRITFEESFAKNMLALRYVEERILDTIITGVEGVGRVYHRDVNNQLVWDESVAGYVAKKQHILDVEGTNLFKLLGLRNVDPTRTFSNDIHEIMEVFGIEAARQAIFDELNEVFQNAAPVNYHHLSVLLDTITYQGRLVPVNRFGMSKHDNGVLAKSSFEETSKILFNAATSASFDGMLGVSANIMFGQKPPCGTGFVDILLDETKMPEASAEDEFAETDLEAANKKIASAPGPGDCRMEDILMEW